MSYDEQSGGGAGDGGSSPGRRSSLSSAPSLSGKVPPRSVFARHHSVTSGIGIGAGAGGGGMSA
eukprot:CAMPEP_0197455556 /NCGR_PEP_ID=MMETSP1175-20131217/41068_1 /TAXON_ID=1003142 /ORGANISM="Triceratium dubium, Strain CCMP147" /LENGTH=63 /DNA_ID=CAMNT_0042989433 /DNA_START=200 /DNA_END=388 /DNA_ORIENTATION=+